MQSEPAPFGAARAIRNPYESGKPGERYEPI
jgi:hypothetical protein